MNMQIQADVCIIFHTFLGISICYTLEFIIEDVLETYFTKVSKKNIKVSEKIKKNWLNKNVINMHTYMHAQV